MNPVDNGTNGTDGVNGEHQSEMQKVPLIIGGKDVFGQETFNVYNPTGGRLWEASGASVADVNRAVAAAEAALPAWAKSKPARRRDIFLKAAEILDSRRAKCAELQKQETGAEFAFADWILKLTVDNLKEVAGKCSAVSGLIPASGDEGRAALVLKQPYGVIVGIAPW